MRLGFMSYKDMRKPKEEAFRKKSVMAKFKNHSKYPLYHETPKSYSGSPKVNWERYLPILRREHFYKEPVDVGGDAPKSFIRWYRYGTCKRKPRSKWPAYIAKVGHKWYPVESITEYLMNRIGEVLGIQMAESKLVLANKQIRFLSRYFLNRDREQLIHGAQIYASYLEDEQFVEDANDRQQQRISRQLFTFQFTEEAVKAVFPIHHFQIMEDFVAMLLLDAVVGNNDRHFYNWGVISNILGESSPKFAPVYDTARGLFWNRSEASLIKFRDNNLGSYIQQSKPRTGWEGLDDPNHFQLVEKIFQEDQRYCELCRRYLNSGTFSKIERLIDEEFTTLLSSVRLEIIKKCLHLRVNKLLDTIC